MGKDPVPDTLECPICEYPRAALRYRLSDRFFAVTDRRFPLYHCSSCGLVFQREDEIRDHLAEFYPPGYWWRRAGRLSSLEKTYREWVLRRDQLRFLLSAVPDRSGRLLDVGCGSGTFIKLALEEGFDAYGLEQSREAVEICEADMPGRIYQGTEQDLIHSGETFDTLTLFHALEHMASPFRYLKDLQKLLRRPGTLIVQVPNVDSLQADLFGSRWYGLDCPRHLYNYSTFSLLHLLGRANFRIRRVRHFSLRDNAAALVSSLFPFLDTMSQRVKLLRRRGKATSWSLPLRQAAYLPLLVLAQPLALAEAGLGRGATVTVHATLD